MTILKTKGFTDTCSQSMAICMGVIDKHPILDVDYTAGEERQSGLEE